MIMSGLASIITSINFRIPAECAQAIIIHLLALIARIGREFRAGVLALINDAESVSTE
jgi:hypothetical protein